MKELQQALSEIHSIRTQVAHGTEFRGYGPASIAISGVLALTVAAAQTQWMAKPAAAELWLWLGVLAGAAVGSVLPPRNSNFSRDPRELRGLPTERGRAGLPPLSPPVEARLPARV